VDFKSSGGAAGRRLEGQQDDSEDRRLNEDGEESPFKWETTEFTENGLKFKMKFKDPL
jgi:hypothetical protein